MRICPVFPGDALSTATRLRSRSVTRCSTSSWPTRSCRRFWTSGSGSRSPAKSAGYSLRAANLLQKLATAEGRLFDLTAAEGTLLGALADKRPENVKAVAGVLGAMNSNNA